MAGGDIEMGGRSDATIKSRYVKDQVREQTKGAGVGERCKNMGFSPKHPVALFNSLSGCVIEVVESKDMPSWSAQSGNENALWVDINKVTSSVLGTCVAIHNIIIYNSILCVTCCVRACVLSSSFN